MRAVQSKSCSEEGDDGFGGEEHLSTEQSHIKVLQTKGQALKECEHKSCSLPVHPAFLPIPGERGDFKQRVERPLEHFPILFHLRWS